MVHCFEWTPKKWDHLNLTCNKGEHILNYFMVAKMHNSFFFFDLSYRKKNLIDSISLTRQLTNGFNELTPCHWPLDFTKNAFEHSLDSNRLNLCSTHGKNTLKIQFQTTTISYIMSSSKFWSFGICIYHIVCVWMNVSVGKKKKKMCCVNYILIFYSTCAVCGIFIQFLIEIPKKCTIFPHMF